MKRTQLSFTNRVFGILLFVVSAIGAQFISPACVKAEGLTQEITQAAEPQTLNLVVGKSVVLTSSKPIKRASLANPKIASTLVLSPKQLYVNGKAIGTTNLTFWGRDGKVFAIYDVRVSPDLKRLKTHLHDLFPKETDVQVKAAHGHITLAGSISGPEVMTQVINLANTYAPKKVMNLMQVGGVQQVMLEVTVAEMAKGLIRRFGVNFINQNTDNVQIGLLDGLSDFDRDSTTGALTHLLGTQANLALGLRAFDSTLSIVLAVLKQHNLTKILAEPTLLAVSGQEASFLAGGEFPIPVPQSFGVTTIKFKKFGVSLNFNPTVLSDGKISLKISPEVSELDFANGLNSQGLVVPAILTRKAKTMIELKDGQSFVIAGLIQDNIRESIAKYPILGDIPILGTLFRSSSFQKNETELIILVTPHLVKPLDKTKQPLPTDAYLEPNDFELMLMGYLEGRKPYASPQVNKGKSPRTSVTTPPVKLGGGLEGQFGHLAP